MKNELNIFERAAVEIVVLLSRLPLRVLYGFSDLFYVLAYRIFKYRVKVVRGNINLAYPNRSEEEKKQIEKDYYRHFCDYVAEMLKGMTISDEELTRRFVVKNTELVERLINEGRHIFLYSPHFGNWEWLTAIKLAIPELQSHCFYQHQNNKVANELTLRARTRHGIVAIESLKGYLFMNHCVRQSKVGSMTLTLGDQCPYIHAKKHWINFMGQDTPFLVGPERIAHGLDIAMIYPRYTYYRRGYYEVELVMIEEHPRDVEESTTTKKFAAMLEEDLNGKYAYLWLWSHRRWKIVRENGEEHYV